jgi:cell wall-associated NlpC family hydrolase
VASSPAEAAAPVPDPDGEPVERPAPDAVVPASPVTLLLSTALDLRGTPYRSGGVDRTGFDCSGFVRYVFGAHGHRLPRETQEQYKVGQPVDRDDVQPGDLVFFETVSRGPSHVGIALGDGEFVHAPSSRGVVRVERYTTTYWARRWVGARRLDTIAE